MAKPRNKKYFPKLPRLKQKTDAHCGPAVLSMLCAFWGKRLDQDLIVRTAKVGKTLKTKGMTVYDMALTVAQLAPEMVLWYRQGATIEQLGRIISRHKIPVGVEWQGVFGKYSDGDDGHYSIVTHIDRRRNQIKISDPFRVFAGQDREFKIEEFARRWWDENEVHTGTHKKITKIRDRQLAFLVTLKNRRFPRNFGMQKII